MISAKQLHGLKVKDKNHNELGIVMDFLAEKSSGKIQGFIIDLPGLIAKKAFLTQDKVVRLDLSGLYIEDKNSFSRSKKIKQKNSSVLRMHQVNSERGAVKDLFLEKGQIMAAEVSGGVFMDMREGRQTIPWEEL